MASPSAYLNILVTADTAPANKALGKTQAQLQATAATADKATAATAGSFASMGKSMSTAGAKMQKFGKTVTTHVGLPLLAVGAYAVKSADEFDKSMTMISTQAGASAKEVKKLSKSVLAFAASGKSAFDPKELSEALFHIESVGYRGAKAMHELRGATKLAAVGGSELEETTYALISAQKTGIRGTQKLGEAMGTLNAIVGHGDIRMEELTQSFSSGLLITAKQLGISLTEVGAAMDVMTARGVKAQNATTSLNMGLLRMATPTSTAAKVLESIGISSEKMAKVMRTEGLPAAVGVLAEKLSGLSKTKANQVLTEAFGVKSAKAVRTLVGNVGELHEKVKQITESTGDFGKKWKETQETPAFKLKAELSQLKAVMIELGNKLLPIVIPLLQQIGGAVKSVIESFTHLPKWTQDWIVKLGIAFIALGPIISGLGTIIKLAGGAATALGGLGGAGAAGGGKAKGGAGGGGIFGGPAGLLAIPAVSAIAVNKFVPKQKGEGSHSFGHEFLQGFADIPEAIFGGLPEAAGKSGAEAAEQFAEHFKKNIGPEIEFALKSKNIGKFAELSGKIQHALKLGIEGGASKAELNPLRALMKKMGDLVAKGMEGLWKRAGGITRAGTSKLIIELAGLSKGVREQSINATLAMYQAWANGHPKIEATVDKLTEHLIQRFGATNKQLREGVKKGATGPIAEAYAELAKGSSAALENLGINTNAMLKALGIKDLVHFKAIVNFNTGKYGQKFTPQGARHRGEGGNQGHRQRGGPIFGGAPSGDSVPAMLERGEYVVNRKAVAAVGKRRLDALNFGAAPRFAAGGEAQVSGPKITAAIGNASIGKVLKGAGQYIAAHRSKRRAGTPGLSVPTGPIQKMAMELVRQVFGGGQWGAFNAIEMSEAGWDPHAQNPESTAYGLAQNLNPSTYPPAGRPGSSAPILEQAKAQLQWMVKYIKERYGSPSSAWAFHQAHNWYQKGGQVSPAGGARENRNSATISSGSGLADAQHVIGWAQHHIGNGPKWGSPEGGWCGLFLGADMKAHGIEPPSGYPAASSWAGWGTPGSSKAGNVVVFDSQHVGLSLGGGKMISGDWSGQVGIGSISEGPGGVTAYRAPPYLAGGSKAAERAASHRKKVEEHFKAGLQGYHKPGRPPKPHARTAVQVPGLKGGAIPKALAGLPPGITSLFTGPRMSREQKFAASELALQVAQQTEGFGDDRAVYQYQRGASEARKLAIQKRINQINKRLRKRMTPQQEKALLAKRGNLETELGTAQGRIVSATEGIKGLGEAEEQKKEETLEEIKAVLEQQLELEQQRNEETQRALNVSQSQYGVLAQAITAVVSGQIGGKIGLGFQAPSVAGSLASY